MPRPFTEQERATIRARLLERSQRLFETRGLRKTSIDEIANEAGISKGAFYQFFDSKEALCLELLESIESKLRVGVLEQAVSGGRGAKARVARILEGFLSSWDEYPLLRNFDKADYEYLVRRLPPEQAQAHMAGDLAFIEAFTAKLKKDGIRPKVSPTVVVNLIRSLFLLSLHRAELHDGYDETMAILIDMIAGRIVGGAR